MGSAALVLGTFAACSSPDPAGPGYDSSSAGDGSTVSGVTTQGTTAGPVGGTSTSGVGFTSATGATVTGVTGTNGVTGTTGVATTGIATTGIATTGIATTGIATTGVDTSGTTGAIGFTATSDTSAGATTSAGTSTTGDASTSAGTTGVGGATSVSNTVATNTVNGTTSTTGGGGDWYPCNGDTSGYDVVVSGGGSSWTVNGGGSYGDMASAMAAGYAMLSGTTKQAMLVQGDGSISADAQLKMPSNMVLNICGTINVTGTTANSDRSPLYARDRSNIDIPHATITGTPAYGMFFRNVPNLHLGQIDIRVSAGLGIRIDNNPTAGGPKVENVTIDNVYVEGTGHHGVETNGVNNLTIGTVTCRDTAYAGLMLDTSTNVEVGLVDGDGCAAGSTYATLRMANRGGRIGDAYPTNVHIGRLIARGGGRGFFCVSESGGAVIDYVDIEGTESDSILIENCYNLTVGNASEQSRIAGSGVRLAARAEFPLTSDITLQNIALNGITVLENPCATNSNFINLTGGTLDICN